MATTNAVLRLKVGELARRTGLTVRTLHHYDQIGLLSPSNRSGSGHRLYGEKDVGRLQKIVSLRQLGLSLEEIGEWLERPRISALQVLELQLHRLQEQIEAQQSLRGKLERIATLLRQRERVSMDEFLSAIEAMHMYEKHFTAEELERIKERGQVVGEARIREVEQEWPELIAAVRAEMQKGTSPTDPVVQKLAQRWMGLVNEFTGGDMQVARKVKRMYDQEPAVQERTGIDSAMFAYISMAMGSGTA